ncbi:MAG TPA: ThiF family adenylyltransferase [Pyrinomonadaceae bacterium]|nr:ThiF family adenylyltransferase [Pyrinomonadaceae bacterium]
MNDWLSRQSFLGSNSDEVLSQCRVGVIGLGGGGSHIAQQLAHLGVGHFLLIDPDNVEASNLNRLVGATKKDVTKATPKTSVARRLIKRINPKAQVITISREWQTEGNSVAGCDVVFGCVDTFSAREEIERICRRFILPFIDIGMDVTEVPGGYMISGQVILSMPGEMCMWCLGFLTEELLAQEAGRYGAAGGRPQVIWPNGILASAAVGTFVQLVTPWRHEMKPSLYLEYDGNTQTVALSNRLHYLEGKICSHFLSSAVGDPFWQ